MTDAVQPHVCKLHAFPADRRWRDVREVAQGLRARAGNGRAIDDLVRRTEGRLRYQMRRAGILDHEADRQIDLFAQAVDAELQRLENLDVKSAKQP